MNWTVEFTSQARKDFISLDNSQRLIVRKAISKVSNNPLPHSEGGYGKPLGNKHGNDLTGLLKIKLKSSGIRIIYKLVRTDSQMIIIVIGMRSDEEVYDTARNRINDSQQREQN